MPHDPEYVVKQWAYVCIKVLATMHSILVYEYYNEMKHFFFQFLRDGRHNAMTAIIRLIIANIFFQFNNMWNFFVCCSG